MTALPPQDLHAKVDGLHDGLSRKDGPLGEALKYSAQMAERGDDYGRHYGGSVRPARLERPCFACSSSSRRFQESRFPPGLLMGPTPPRRVMGCALCAAGPP